MSVRRDFFFSFTSHTSKSRSEYRDFRLCLSREKKEVLDVKCYNGLMSYYCIPMFVSN